MKLPARTTLPLWRMAIGAGEEDDGLDPDEAGALLGPEAGLATSGGLLWEDPEKLAITAIMIPKRPVIIAPIMAARTCSDRDIRDHQLPLPPDEVKSSPSLLMYPPR